MEILWLIVLCGALAIVYAIWATYSVLQADPGSDRMQEIAAAVRVGAQAYLKRQYATIAAVGVVIFLIVGYFLGWLVGIGFAVGAILSGSAGFIGMNVSVRANVRTAQAAIGSLAGGLELAFRAGAITGLLVAGLALLGVTLYFGFLTHGLDLAPNDRTVVNSMVALGFGASLISIFARLGGGIFTKGADVGGDLVGKVEAGIPEDDPRNPATIADNVGDNVGDCAGMAADLFETYAVTTVATMVLAAIFFGSVGTDTVTRMMTLPARHRRRLHHRLDHRHVLRQARRQSVDHGRAVQGHDRDRDPVADRHRRRRSITSSASARSPASIYSGAELFYCGITGLVVTGLIIWITEYYTGTNYRPVRSIAMASVTGHGTNVIQGLAVSLEATALPALVIIAGILVSYNLAGPFRHRHRGDDDAGARRHRGRARCLRSGHRQCRRHCRNGRPAEGGAQVDRCARRRRQHHQGGDQGLRDRLGRPGRAGAVRGLQSGPELLHRKRGDRIRISRASRSISR